MDAIPKLTHAMQNVHIFLRIPKDKVGIRHLVAQCAFCAKSCGLGPIPHVAF